MFSDSDVPFGRLNLAHCCADAFAEAQSPCFCRLLSLMGEDSRVISSHSLPALGGGGPFPQLPVFGKEAVWQPGQVPTSAVPHGATDASVGEPSCFSSLPWSCLPPGLQQSPARDRIGHHRSWSPPLLAPHFPKGSLRAPLSLGRGTYTGDTCQWAGRAQPGVPGGPRGWAPWCFCSQTQPASPITFHVTSQRGGQDTSLWCPTGPVMQPSPKRFPSLCRSPADDQPSW